MKESISGDEALIRALHVCDDGRNWNDWIVWRMGERKRISEGAFALPPERQQVMPPSIKPKKKPKRRQRRKIEEII